MGAVRVPHGVETGYRKGYPAGTRRFRDRGLHKGPVRITRMGIPDRSLMETTVTKSPGSRRVQAHMDYPDGSRKTNSSYTLQELGVHVLRKPPRGCSCSWTSFAVIQQFYTFNLQY
jgi:hypothetical protein